MTNYQKRSLVAFYRSKYNDKAKERLGYKNVTDALNDLSERLKGDVYFDNGRVGYRNESLQMMLRVCIIDGMSFHLRNYLFYFLRSLIAVLIKKNHSS